MADQGERIEVDPRRAFRARKQALAEGRPPSAAQGLLAPSLLAEPGAGPETAPHRTIRQIGSVASDPEGPDPYHDALYLRVRPGRRRSGKARVRVYHVLNGLPANDPDARCWAFTIGRRAWDRLVTERVLDSDGATYPDGSPVVRPGVEPMDISVRCGSCGTTSVECLQMEFYEDG